MQKEGVRIVNVVPAPALVSASLSAGPMTGQHDLGLRVCPVPRRMRQPHCQGRDHVLGPQPLVRHWRFRV